MKVGDWVYRKNEKTVHKVLGFGNDGRPLLNNIKGGHRGQSNTLYDENKNPIKPELDGKDDKWFVLRYELTLFENAFKENDIVYLKEDAGKSWLVQLEDFDRERKNNLKHKSACVINATSIFDYEHSWGDISQIEFIRLATSEEQQTFYTRCPKNSVKPVSSPTFKFKVEDKVKIKEGGFYFASDFASTIKEKDFSNFPSESNLFDGVYSVESMFRSEINGFNWYVISGHGNAYTEEALMLEETTVASSIVPLEGYSEKRESLINYLKSNKKLTFLNGNSDCKYVGWNSTNYWFCNASAKPYSSLPDFKKDDILTTVSKRKHVKDLKYPDVVAVRNEEEYKKVSKWIRLDNYAKDFTHYLAGGFGKDVASSYEGKQSTKYTPYVIYTIDELIFPEESSVEEVALYKWKVYEPYTEKIAVALQSVAPQKKPFAFDEKEFDSKAFNKEYSLNKIKNKSKTKTKISFL
jgi:hypothetical protein